ncbi:MFS transporter [Streptomyces sp. SID3343]|uniref:MFS transporter n=1 Tax=Streptomyces sp. SID3343 TaxID=2690260 RepID=UPI00136B34E2|nr:MFS transporter [Streptomyces sp. SID3343]MYW02970.1 MFS transporter [Streptomyces sp. SID3343]
MNKRYALWSYALGATVARMGDEMSGPALLLAGLAATGSAAAASSLLAGITVSAAIGGPVFGVLLDRSAAPGRLLAWALAGYAVALTVILVSLGRVPVAVTVLIAVCAGLLGPALSGGWTSQVPRVVGSAERLPRANALDAMTFNLASLVGPALAGIVAGLAGAPTGVVVATALICLALPSALMLPVARMPQEPSVRSSRSAPTTSVSADLADGFRAIARSRPLARATTTSVVSCAGQGVLIACVPLLGEQVLGAADRGAFLLSGLAAAALAANVLLSRRPTPIRPDTVVRGSTVVLAIALLLAATRQPVLLVAAMVIAGLGEGPQLTALFAVRHREAPQHLRGRIFTTGASLKITGFSVGAGIAGPIAGRSLSGALVAGAGIQALAWLSSVRFGRPGGSSGRERSSRREQSPRWPRARSRRLVPARSRTR